MRGLRPALIIALALASTQAHGKRPAPPGFAEPGDIIAAEGNFTHVSAAKGVKPAIRATAAADAEIFAPQLMRVAEYVTRASDAELTVPWHTSQVWMSCDGSVAVTHGTWQRPSAIGWFATIWRRQKGGGYKWVLAQGGALTAAPADSDMISASVADCPVRRARGVDTQTSTKAPADYTSGHADDGTLVWATIASADGRRSFVLQIKQDGVLHEVLRATAAPAGA